jgi:hypothetical protein
MKIEMPPSAYCATSYSKNIGGILSMINQKKNLHPVLFHDSLLVNTT